MNSSTSTEQKLVSKVEKLLSQAAEASKTPGKSRSKPVAVSSK
jgi:hypothetical protein